MRKTAASIIDQFDPKLQIRLGENTQKTSLFMMFSHSAAMRNLGTVNWEILADDIRCAFLDYALSKPIAILKEVTQISLAVTSVTVYGIDNDNQFMTSRPKSPIHEPRFITVDLNESEPHASSFVRIGWRAEYSAQMITRIERIAMALGLSRTSAATRLSPQIIDIEIPESDFVNLNVGDVVLPPPCSAIAQNGVSVRLFANKDDELEQNDLNQPANGLLCAGLNLDGLFACQQIRNSAEFNAVRAHSNRRLRITLPSVNVNLTDLSEWRDGKFIAKPFWPDQQAFSVASGGRIYGQGVLVDVSGRVGVQLTSWSRPNE